MLKRIKDNAGETITETIVATLIVVMAVTMVAGAVFMSARVNSAAVDMGVGFTTVKDDGTSNLKDVAITVTMTNATSSSGVTFSGTKITAQQTDDSNEYTFYTIEDAG